MGDEKLQQSETKECIIGKKIKYIRDYFNLTQEQLSAKVGLSKRTVASYEACETTPTKGKINLICSSFNIGPSYFKDEVEIDRLSIFQFEYPQELQINIGIPIQNIDQDELNEYFLKIKTNEFESHGDKINLLDKIMSSIEGILRLLDMQDISELSEVLGVDIEEIKSWKVQKYIPDFYSAKIEGLIKSETLPYKNLVYGRDANMARLLMSKFRKLDKRTQKIVFDTISNASKTEIDKLVEEHNKSIETVTAVKLSPHISAGNGSNIESIDSVEKMGEFVLDICTFKTPPPKRLFAMQVDGYSMIPMVFPDSWVVFDDATHFKGDGLYVINWRNVLMVKLLQVNSDGMFRIVSANKDYESYTVEPDDQSVFRIFGKVLRTII